MSRIKINESRFALLMNDDNPNRSKKKNKKPENQQNKQQKQGQANKQSQNKKKGTESRRPPSGASIQSSRSLDNGRTDSNTNNEDSWSQWRERDEEFTEEAYEKDLQEALLLSKLEIEQQKQLKKQQKSSEIGKNEESNRSKKKKKKAMSLQEFNSTVDQESSGQTEERSESDEPTIPIPATKIPPKKANDKYFNEVENNANKILRKEKLQEEYKKHYENESVMASKYQEELQKKAEEIIELQSRYQALEEEHKKVKKRNKQLCYILAEGEMKDKSEVLLQVEELSQVKDELTSQVSSLTAELEKERSKVHTLKSELDKIKTGKAVR